MAEVVRDCPPGVRIAAFTSGGPIAAMVGSILGLGAQAVMALSWQLVNASITRLRFSPGRVGLATFNEYAHLEQCADAALVTYR
jgi:broad specificity phosphatase PhoE